MMIDLEDDTLLYVLGYITAEQWIDAMEFADDKDGIQKLLNVVDKRYSGMKDAVDNLIKEKIVERLSK